MAELLPVIKASFYDSNGEPLSGGKLYSYEAGTTTPKATYTNRAGNVANTNPVILDADGQADVWLGEGFYKFTLEDSAGNLQYTEDNIASPQIGALESAFWRGVVYITSAESPYTVTTSDNGKLISVDSSGGAVSVILPEISSLNLPFNVGVKRSTGSGLVTTTRSGTDTINGNTSKSFSLVGMGCQFIGTNTTSPDKWETNDFLDFYDGVVTPVKLSSESLAIQSVLNYSLTTSVATNAMTIALKDAAGSDPSATSPVRATFRNGTATTGTAGVVNQTAALSITIPASATLGLTSAVDQYIWLYLVNDAGALDLAVCGGDPVDDGSLQSCTAITSGATSAMTLYSSTSHTGAKPVKLIGRIKSNQTVSGTYGSNATEITLDPVLRVQQSTSTSVTTWAIVGWDTVANTTVVAHRTGRHLTGFSIFGNITTGNGTAAGVTMPYSVLSSGVLSKAKGQRVGHFYRLTGTSGFISATSGPYPAFIDTATLNKIFLSSAADGSTGFASVTGTSIGWGGGDGFTFTLDVPLLINGWWTYGPATAAL